MIRPRITYANVVATLALVLAVGGASAFAADQLAKNSVGTKQLKNNAVTTAKIKNGAVTGAKVNLGSLGTVPSATSAINAIHANSADNASHANNADTLGGIGSSGFSRAATSSINNNALVGTSGTAREVNITAPQNGFVLVVASSDVFGNTEDFFNCFLRVDGTEIEGSRRTSAVGPASDSEDNCDTNTIVPVSAGTHNVKFDYSGVGPTTTVDETELNVVFVPLAG
ncbi:MAG TPA: hypothetical protein VFP21_11010 [Solirubrobacterales bacterium]|nr:hypothetical protein [Solirubrobacterales bacterium]